MFKIITLILTLIFPLVAFASGGESLESGPDLTFTWLGILLVFIFITGYYFIAREDHYHIDKAKPALLIGVSMILLIAFYYAINSLDIVLLQAQVNHLILEIVGIFFFLFVAMTFIELMIHMNIFNKIKYNLVSKGYTYKQIFWRTGFLAFFLSPIADNLTTALILSTVLITIEQKNLKFLIPAAINIVVSANAGGAFSPFGDITTLMAYVAGKGSFIDFLFLFPSAFLGYLVTAYLLSTLVPNNKPDFDASSEKSPILHNGAKTVIAIGIFTIISAIVSHQVLHLSPMWGMLFGLSIVKIYSYKLKIKKGYESFDVYKSITKIENNTLFFFFGILAAVGALYIVGWLSLAAVVYNPNVLGPTWSNIGVGILSAIVDNVPVMSAVLKANPDMPLAQWMLVTLTAGIGGSLISFGSAAGVGVMGKLNGIYTFSAHLRYSWMIFIGYCVSVGIWYLQYQILGIGI